jgi:hypothetical protein
VGGDVTTGGADAEEPELDGGFAGGFEPDEPAGCALLGGACVTGGGDTPAAPELPGALG